MRHKTYPLHIVTEALTLYNLGYTREETAAKLKSKTGRAVAVSTIDTWITDNAAVISFRRWRRKSRALFPPYAVVRSIKLYHRQIYGYAFHRAKLAFLRAGLLDDKRASAPANAPLRQQSSARFAALADFLEAVPRICPHDLFRDEPPHAMAKTPNGGGAQNSTTSRASQSKFVWADIRSVIVNTKSNMATQAAALIIPATGDNKLRHERLQRFMLANDSVTLAMEVPLWLTEPDIAALERQHKLELIPRQYDESGTPIPRLVTGHMDFLQVRNGAVHILDYKPDARTNKPVAQLTLYALALTRLVPGLPLFDIKCAWFNEEEYNEFFPRTLIAAARKKTSAALID